MKCLQCGAETPDEEWNCVSCRMNVYWASQHYDNLTGIRRQQGLHEATDIPPFLLRAHESAMNDRASRGGKTEHKVRQIARRVMSERARSRSATTDPGPEPRAADRSRADADAAPGWNQAGTQPTHLADLSAGQRREGA